jgi:hypothetical protein
MPWRIGTHESCPASKPHAVLAKAGGKLMGCHASEEEAKAQIAALYAKEPKAKSMKYEDVERYFAEEARARLS